MNTKVKQANYNQDVVGAIVAEYKTLITENGNNNAEVLDSLSKKHGKSVHSLRAKLASLKVYVKTTPSEVNGKGQKKEQLLDELELLAGEELSSLTSATKRDLQTLIDLVRFCKR